MSAAPRRTGIAKTFPPSVNREAIDRYIAAGREAARELKALQTKGTPLPASAIAELRVIAKRAASWHEKLQCRWSLRMPELQKLQYTAERMLELYSRSCAHPRIGSQRKSLIADLYAAYRDARGNPKKSRGGKPKNSPRGFVNVSNALLKSEGRAPITRAEMRALGAEMLRWDRLVDSLD
jgi:hypothetical protein